MQINNDDPGSVITWDFDVMRQDVIFSVLHTKVPLPMKETVHSPTGMPFSFSLSIQLEFCFLSNQIFTELVTLANFYNMSCVYHRYFTVIC